MNARIPRMQSLRWHLLVAVSAAVLLIWLFTGWSSYVMARHEAEELMDGNLAQSGHLLLAIMHDNEAQLADIASRLASVRGAADNIYEPPLEFQVGRSDGAVLARSLDAPELPILGVTGYSDIVRHNGSWRVLNTVSDDGRYRVQVSQPISLRDRAALEVASRTVLPLVVIVPILILLIYVSILRGLRPLDRLASDVAARSPENLSPLSGHDIPTEARPLVTSLNRLFDRVSGALENERRFTADAAHEMRTPLAAIKVQSQVALLSADAGQRDNALRQIKRGVDRAAHLVDQLLRLARLDPLHRLPNPVPIGLNNLIRQALGEVLVVHAESARPIRDDLPPTDVTVLGDAELLGIALRNLFDNAIRYSGPGDAIGMRLDALGNEVTISVHDSGPGVPDGIVDKLNERFFRGDDPAAEGSGLGLAIVTRIAELHGARLVLCNRRGGGFAARIEGLKSLAAGARDRSSATAPKARVS
jgi:two-component system, OmpR family, sensor histidine kinase QseC